MSWPITIAAFSAYLAAVFARYPELVTAPRFWAEEGRVYFQSAYDHGFAAVFEPHVGYYALYPSLATWLATLVPLAQAPVVTLVFAALGQALPAFLVLRSRSALLGDGVRVVLLIALVVNPSAVFELWLNTVNTQSFLQVAVFLLLLEPRLRAWHVVLLGVCLLSAPTAIVVAAGFVVRALVRGGRIEWVAVGLWGAAIALQAAMPRAGVRDIVSPRIWGVALARETFGRAWLGGLSLPMLTLGGVAVVVFSVGLILASRLPGLWLLGGLAFATATVNTALSLGGSSGARYAFAPFVMLLCVVLIAVTGPLRGRVLANVAIGLVAVAVFGGVVGLLDRGGWPPAPMSWAEQVAQNAHTVRISPGLAEWTVTVRR